VCGDCVSSSASSLFDREIDVCIASVRGRESSFSDSISDFDSNCIDCSIRSAEPLNESLSKPRASQVGSRGAFSQTGFPADRSIKSKHNVRYRQSTTERVGLSQRAFIQSRRRLRRRRIRSGCFRTRRGIIGLALKYFRLQLVKRISADSGVALNRRLN